MTDNTQLPAEVLGEITKKAEEKYSGFNHYGACKMGYVAGAVEYATKLLQAQQEIEGYVEEIESAGSLIKENEALQAKCDRHEKENKDLTEALKQLVDVLPKGESLRRYHAKERLIYARGVLVIHNEALSAGVGENEDQCTMCKEKPKGEGTIVCNECYNAFDGDRRGFWTSDNFH